MTTTLLTPSLPTTILHPAHCKAATTLQLLLSPWRSQYASFAARCSMVHGPDLEPTTLVSKRQDRRADTAGPNMVTTEMSPSQSRILRQA